MARIIYGTPEHEYHLFILALDVFLENKAELNAESTLKLIKQYREKLENNLKKAEENLSQEMARQTA